MKLKQSKAACLEKVFYAQQKRQHCVSFTDIKLWNSIEKFIIDGKTNQIFKTKYKYF